MISSCLFYHMRLRWSFHCQNLNDETFWFEWMWICVIFSCSQIEKRASSSPMLDGYWRSFRACCRCSSLTVFEPHQARTRFKNFERHETDFTKKCGSRKHKKQRKSLYWGNFLSDFIRYWLRMPIKSRLHHKVSESFSLYNFLLCQQK